MSKSSHLYLAQCRFFEQFPEVADKYLDKQFVDGVLSGSSTAGFEVGSFFGPAGTYTGLHHDDYDNVFIQCAGYKRLTLISPDVI